MYRHFVPLVLVAVAGGLAAQEPKTPPKKPAGVPPTHENVPYGEHPRQVLDFYQAKSDAPTPVVFSIHGGGWVNGDKSSYRNGAKRYLDAGISVVAINYRVRDAGGRGQGRAAGEVAARGRGPGAAVRPVEGQGVEPRQGRASGRPAGRPARARRCGWRSTTTWPTRRAPTRSPASPPGCTAPRSTGRRPRSTRRCCASGCRTIATAGTRSASAPEGSRDGAFQEFFEKREKLLPWIKEYSPITHVTKDDPPVFMEYPSQKKPPVKGENQDDPTHSALLGMILMEKLKAAGVEAILVYPGHPHEKYKTSADYLIDRLKAK